MNPSEQRFYVRRDGMKHEFPRRLLGKENDADISGSELWQEMMYSLSDEALHAVSIDGARSDFLAYDNGKSADRSSLAQENKRKKASMCPFPKTKHVAYLLMIGQSVRSRHHRNNAYTASFFRPLRLRAVSTLRPPTVALRFRNPCRRLRFNFFG